MNKETSKVLKTLIEALLIGFIIFLVVQCEMKSMEINKDKPKVSLFSKSTDK